MASQFGFESQHKELKQCVHGPRGVTHQMVQCLLARKVFIPSLVEACQRVPPLLPGIGRILRNLERKPKDLAYRSVGPVLKVHHHISLVDKLDQFELDWIAAHTDLHWEGTGFDRVMVSFHVISGVKDWTRTSSTTTADVMFMGDADIPFFGTVQRIFTFANGEVWLHVSVYRMQNLLTDSLLDTVTDPDFAQALRRNYFQQHEMYYQIVNREPESMMIKYHQIMGYGHWHIPDFTGTSRCS